MHGFEDLRSDYAERGVKAEEISSCLQIARTVPFFPMAGDAGNLALSGSFGRAVRPAGPRGPEVYMSFDSFSCPWQIPADLSVYVAKFAKTGDDARSAVSSPDNQNFR